MKVEVDIDRTDDCTGQQQRLSAYAEKFATPSERPASPNNSEQ